MTPEDANRVAALSAEDGSTRLRAALAIGAEPSPGLDEALIARCAVEPDFFVREMLTWALTRFPAEITLPGLLVELRSDRPQARSQALHTLSKIRDGAAWPAITSALLRDSDDEVARSAWRAAVVLVPEAEKGALAAELASQLGRGGREMQLSLSRAFMALGEEAAGPALEKAKASPDPGTRAHALAMEHFLRDPTAGLDFALEQAKRFLARGA